MAMSAMVATATIRKTTAMPGPWRVGWPAPGLPGAVGTLTWGLGVAVARIGVPSGGRIVSRRGYR
jgi:hypothetical protein